MGFVQAPPGRFAERSFEGGFLDEVDTFDAEFFGISPREAQSMDPQHRLVLETAWEALERAGIAPSSLKNSLTGVFIGISGSEYATLLAQGEDSENPYLASGNALSGAAGRLSYFLGLQGPCFTIDAACASSLVSLHAAAQALRNKECDLAISGGVNIVLSSQAMATLTQAHMISPDGHCKTFDARADGYGRGEGCGIVVLKRLSDALKDQDTILAILKGSSVLQDGASSGLTVPNGLAQERLMRQALENAKADPNQIHYIEAHGTGTSLGDPIEIGSITDVYGEKRKEPLIIGTVKSNIGHLESAAGVAGVIKTTLILQNEKIPKNLNFETLNPKINLEKIPAIVPTETLPWPRTETPRLAAVSSFGFTGTIAHAILEEAPKVERIINANDRPLHLLTLSAKTDEALQELIRAYLQYPLTDDLADIAYTANTGRAHFEQRLVVSAKDTAEMLSKLQSGDYLIGQAPSQPPKIAFIFRDQEPYEIPGIIPDYVIRSGFRSRDRNHDNRAVS